MKHIFYFALAFVTVSCSTGISIEKAAENFQNPDSTYGVSCWWWWLNGNVTKEAIDVDLQAMKEKGFCGAMIFDAGGQNQRGNKNVPAGPVFGSEEWTALFTYALDKADSLGLEMGFNIQSGWNLGGPCITAEYAAKRITFYDTLIHGGGECCINMALPKTSIDYYKDIAVLAFPISEERISPEPIYFLEGKLCDQEMGRSAPDCRYLLDNSKKQENAGGGRTPYIVDRNSILDISEKMDSNGTVLWNIPKGKWAIIRIGYTCTGAEVSTSSDTWQGLVLDYLSDTAARFYLKTVVDPILKAAGHHVGTTLKYMETDSWECGGMNWTDDFPAKFAKFNGYELKRYLPVVGGYIVDDMESTSAFLADFRKCIGNCIAENHYGILASYAHEHGMGVQPESGGPHAGPIDGLKNFSYSDIVMGEFWTPSPHRTAPEDKFFIKQASSAAHIYGKKIVGAESFTTIGPHWNDEIWHDQKSAFDHEICAGLNRVYFHTFTCSPKEMGLPGQEYFAGTHVNPRVTWWNEAGGFTTYMARIQSLMQEAKFSADILYYYGDHIPVIYPNKHSDLAGAMPGYDYDVTGEDALLQCTVNKEGRIVVPSGLSYRVLVLPDHGILSEAALKKVQELLQGGATVIGRKPEKCVSLAADHNRFAEIADSISVVCDMSAREYLLNKGIAQDFAVREDPMLNRTDFIHCTLDGHDIYFIANLLDSTADLTCTFRSSGRQPELWNAITGKITMIGTYNQNEDGTTTIPLRFDPCGSAIIVFGKKTDHSATGEKNWKEFSPCMQITGPWKVKFDTVWGGPAETEFKELEDWTLSEDERIRYYSGHASYSTEFDFHSSTENEYWLDLGKVKDVGMATVVINGHDAGLAWTSPFRIEISKYLVDGTNTLEVTVVNSWFNRVAGDQTHPEERQFTGTNIVLSHDFTGKKIDNLKLSPSGLLGPVQILQEQK